MRFIKWRQVPDKRKGKYKACHNTALLELKVLGLIMSEAVQRDYAPYNPCRDLKIGKMKAKEKPELTDSQIEFIRTKIEDEPEPLKTFFRNSLEIARYQGCRISETYLNPMDQVTFHRDPQGKVIKANITFFAKGGRIHTPPLHPALWPLFEKLQADGRKETYTKPYNPSRQWWRFLKKIKMKATDSNICFHSLRVTAATRLARSDVKESSAMKFLGHASVTVHRAYQRLKSDDLGDCLEALE
jgi:integrase